MQGQYKRAWCLYKGDDREQLHLYKGVGWECPHLCKGVSHGGLEIGGYPQKHPTNI